MKKFFKFLKNNVWGTITTLASSAYIYVADYAPELLEKLASQLPEHTLLSKLSPVIIAMIAHKKAKEKYQKDELPSGLSKMYDKLPNKITGIKGSKK